MPPFRMIGCHGVTTPTSGSPLNPVDKIPSGLVEGEDYLIAKEGEFVMFYELDEDSGLDSEYPYRVKPNDADHHGSPKRWKMMGMRYIPNDLLIKEGHKLRTEKVQGLNGRLTLHSGSGHGHHNYGQGHANGHNDDDVDLGGVYIDENGDLVCENNIRFEGDDGYFVLPDNVLIENLNSEYLNGLLGDEFVTRDGSQSFTAPVSGIYPFRPEHLVTKQYVDEFSNSITGIESIEDDVSRVVVPFANVLSTAGYKVFHEITNTVDAIPSVFSTIVTSKSTSGFVVELSDTTDSENYLLNYMVIP